MRKGVSVRDVYKIGKTIGTGGALLCAPPCWLPLPAAALRCWLLAPHHRAGHGSPFPSRRLLCREAGH